MKRLVVLVLLFLVSCSQDPYSKVYVGDIAESWQVAKSTDINSGSNSITGVELSFVGTADSKQVAKIQNFELTVVAEDDGATLSIEPQTVEINLNEKPTKLRFEGELTFEEDGGVILELLGSPVSGSELLGMYTFSFLGQAR